MYPAEVHQWQEEENRATLEGGMSEGGGAGWRVDQREDYRRYKPEGASTATEFSVSASDECLEPVDGFNIADWLDTKDEEGDERVGAE